MNTPPLFGDPDDIWESKGKRHPFSDRKPGQRHPPIWTILGKGPEGKRCSDCVHLVVRRQSKTYFKCGLSNITRGRATDIGARDPSCSKFKAA